MSKSLKACKSLRGVCILVLFLLLFTYFFFSKSTEQVELSPSKPTEIVFPQTERKLVKLNPNPSPLYSPSLLILTSIFHAKGDVREKERNLVLSALCEGENRELLLLHKFTVYVSIDGSDSSPSLPSSCSALSISFLYPRIDERDSVKPFDLTPTGRISLHYRFALKRMFQLHTHVIVLEDDLLPSPDFVSLFVPTSPAFALLTQHSDRIWCISSWNDMGVSTHSVDTTRLFLTDFFPGLGWMMTRPMFDSVMRRKWPSMATTGWDNWLRANNEEERECVVPQVNRVKHISPFGVNVQSKTEYQVFSFSQETRTAWKMAPTLDTYDHDEFQQVVASKRVYSLDGIVPNPNQRDNLVYVYDRSGYAAMLNQLGMFPPMREEPRSSRQGLLTIPLNAHTFLFLCDRVRCAPRFFPQEVFFPPTANVYRALPGESCHKTCESHQRRCDDVNLQTIAFGGRTCKLMRTYFDCPNGCGHQVGQELPALAIRKQMDTFGQCLWGESAVPTCDAFHPHTKRLCSCVVVVV